MPLIRVRATDTGHEMDIPESTFDPAAHKRLDSAHYPDLPDGSRARAVKYRTDKAGKAPSTTLTKEN